MTAHYVYRVYDKSERLIYVGVCKNLSQRIDTHRMNTWWASDAAKVKASVYPSPEAARAVERAAIREEDPRWNITGAWRCHRSWDEDRYVDYVTAVINGRMFGPGYLTEYVRTHIQNVRRLFRARFGHDLATPVFTEAVA